MRIRMLRPLLLCILAVAIGLGWASRARARTGDPERELASLARRSGTELQARLSILPQGAPGTGTLPTRQIGVLTRRLDVLADSGHARALHLRSLAELLWGAPGELRPVDRAIESLHTVQRLQGPSATLYSDLAAAHLVRADRGGTAHDLVLAIHFAGQAAALEPRNSAALYNRALALERFHLRYQAAEAWRAVIALDAGSAAATEARSRLRALAEVPPTRPANGAPAAALAAFAREHPQWARMWATDTLLPGWGRAVGAGDSARARARLAAASAVGDALAGRPGDGSVAQLVAEIRRVERDPSTLTRIAGAWAAYGRAAAALDVRHGAEAVARFDSVHAAAGASPMLRLWARYNQGVGFFYAFRADASSATIAPLAASVDARRFPALAGRIQWSMATLALRRGYSPECRAHIAEAARHFKRAGEAENQAAMHAMDVEALFALGADAEAYDTAHHALATLRPYGRSVRRHNLLFALVHYTRLEGLNEAALALQGEDIDAVAGRSPGDRVEALLSRARALAAAGRYDQAETDVRDGGLLVDTISSEVQRAWMTADLRTARAALRMRVDPRAAAAAMDSVIQSMPEDAGVERLLIARMQRAEARVAAGDASGGAADMQAAVALVGRLAENVQNAALRSSLLDSRRRIFDRLALLHLRHGRPRDALLVLERSRAPLATGAVGAPARLASRPGEAVLQYLLVGDTLVRFALAGTALRVERTTTDGAALQRAAEAARTRLELRLADDSTTALLAGLYDVLLRPVEAHVAGHGRLAIVVDGELGGVPFAALRDTVRGRYLVQSHAIRFAAGITRGAASGETRGREAAAFVADPAFRTAEFPGLQRLAHAFPETWDLAATYPGARLLTGDSAHLARVQDALSRASLFHFAGHAVFDDSRPARSYLVLAPGSGGADGAGRLTAEQIEGMDLRRVRLVVLAACQTQRSGPGRSGGFAGLSGAMLRAGAGGVAGSLWRVDDRLTGELMRELHRAYRASGDAPAALRQAQLRLLDSPDPALRSPAAWAGFRYAGG